MKNTYLNLTEQSFEFPQNGFELKNGFITFHKVSLEKLIKKYGTPFRLFNLPNIAEKIKLARNLFNQSFDIVTETSWYPKKWCRSKRRSRYFTRIYRS